MAYYPSGYAFGFDSTGQATPSAWGFALRATTPHVDPTGRCHKGEFLLKFAIDRRRWLQWLFEARRRYGLSVLNYTVTSNHIHLLVADDKTRNVIPDSIKLIAGRTGQEFNQRKARKGSYWEDRYHATAIDEGDHLIKCIVYIDLNMVKAEES